MHLQRIENKWLFEDEKVYTGPESKTFSHRCSTPTTFQALN